MISQKVNTNYILTKKNHCLVFNQFNGINYITIVTL